MMNKWIFVDNSCLFFQLLRQSKELNICKAIENQDFVNNIQERRTFNINLKATCVAVSPTIKSLTLDQFLSNSKARSWQWIASYFRYITRVISDIRILPNCYSKRLSCLGIQCLVHGADFKWRRFHVYKQTKKINKPNWFLKKKQVELRTKYCAFQNIRFKLNVCQFGVWKDNLSFLTAAEDTIKYATKPQSTHPRSCLSHYTALGGAGYSTWENVDCKQDYYQNSI